MTQKRNSPLAAELAWYESNKTQWLKDHDGQFALISDNTLGGFYPSYEKALEAGIQTFGVEKDFLIKQIVEQEPVFVIY